MENEKPKQPKRKPFSKPSLRVYGNINTITQAAMMGGPNDNIGLGMKTGA